MMASLRRSSGCGMVRVREEKKLGLGFLMCEGEKAMRCHVLVGYF